MKNLSLLVILQVVITYSFAQGQFKIRNDAYIQIGYGSYKALTFGISTSSPNNGNFSIEHCSGCSPAGLNIWKPWPTSGAANYLLYIRDNGNIGIGNSGDASAKLNVSGSVRATSYITVSDERLKVDFVPISNALERLSAITIYQYKYRQSHINESDSNSVNVIKANNPYHFDDEKTHIGFKAQEIKNIYPELVVEDENGYLSVNYVEFVPLLIKSIQELKERIKILEEEISR